MGEHGCPGATPVSDYPAAQGLYLISASDIIAVLRAKTIRVKAARLGFAPEDVRTHCLSSGGAMAMHLVDVPNRILMTIGRWRSLGFVVYIREQISSFSVGVPVKISQQPWFWYN